MTDHTGPAPSGAIVATELAVRYQRGPDTGVRGVSFVLAPGEGLLVEGPAGCGKTSLLRGLLALAPTEGEVLLLGLPPWRAEARARVGYGPQRWPVPVGLRADEVVRAVAGVRGVADRRAEVERALARAGLPAAGVRADRLEVEDARRLALACAIVGDPPLILLDDPWEFPETLAEIRAARERGAAVIATSPDPGALGAVLGRRLVLKDGAPA